LNENILVVDDDAEVRKTLSSILFEEGYLVETVENGKEAIRASEKSRFEVALIDIKLPDMEGTELLHRLEEKQPHMVKIVITGFPTLENAMKTVNEGADGYILKPFDAGELLVMIEEHLKRQRETMKYSDKKVAEYIETRVREVELEKQKRRVH
jgi:DNA-binding NtrC family response regulator